MGMVVLQPDNSIALYVWTYGKEDPSKKDSLELQLPPTNPKHSDVLKAFPDLEPLQGRTIEPPWPEHWYIEAQQG